MTPRRGNMHRISGRINPSLRGRTSKTSMALATVGVLNARKRSSTAGSKGSMVISPGSRKIYVSGRHYMGVATKTRLFLDGRKLRHAPRNFPLDVGSLIKPEASLGASGFPERAVRQFRIRVHAGNKRVSPRTARILPGG